MIVLGVSFIFWNALFYIVLKLKKLAKNVAQI